MNRPRFGVVGAIWCVLLVALPVGGADERPSESGEPQRVFIGQPLRPEENGQAATVEGVVTFVGKSGRETTLELSSEAGHMLVNVGEADDAISDLLLKGRVRAKGICVGTHNAVGEIVGSLSSPGWRDITVLQVPQETWRKYPMRSIAAVRDDKEIRGQIVHLRGRTGLSESDGAFHLTDATGELTIHPPGEFENKPGVDIELLAAMELDHSNAVFNCVVSRGLAEGKRASPALPILTTTEQVRWLKPEEADKRYPVKIRGVITFLFGPPKEAAGNLQDGTGGIYAWHLVPSKTRAKVKIGDFCEIEGETSAGEYSPGIDCRKLTVLGRGEFPVPVRPSWDELNSGALDAQWVEVEGLALSATPEHLVIGFWGGRIACFVLGSTNLMSFSNAVVRVRGVVVADRDQARHVQGQHLNLPSEKFISLEAPPLGNLFSLPAKHIKELLYYEPRESAFRREKVTGQIIGARDGIGYLMEGTNGLRLMPKEDTKLQIGDAVEAVGFPEIDNSGDAPLLTLREASVRVSGRTDPPPPRELAPGDLLNCEHDSTLVRVRAQLVRLGRYGSDQVLELQSSARTFFARLRIDGGRIGPLKPGSLLEITGVEAFNHDRSGGRAQAGPFELLLNSPADLRVLELPSWWTTEHALTVVGGMAVLMLLALVWITLLRQQVGVRTAQLSAANHSLENEIVERKRAENELVRTRLQHLVEQERTRIARDIHDELGSSLSQIRLLSELTLSKRDASPEAQSNAGRISAKALEATNVLDEIVWAVDPRNDTLESVVNYLFSFASDYLSLAGIRFRIDAPTRVPHHVLTAPVRHQLYMALKETLTNIVNHARAMEVWIRLRLENGAACFIIEDNGRGFDSSGQGAESPGASGLENMRARFREIGGDCILESAPNKGTSVKFVLPLSEAASS